MSKGLAFKPLTPARWNDLVDLFGPGRGACAGCWCMWPRMRGVEFKAMTKVARRDAFRRLVENGPPPGLLAYEGRTAVGWVAVGPRRDVARFNLSRVTAPTDEVGADLGTTWAITCFYVRASHRKRGLMQCLARAAIGHARKHGARRIEACPIEPARALIWGEAFVGIPSALTPLGFREIARRSPRRPLLCLDL
jgi:GNAT superfamily N-acetyltransferase